MSEIPDFPVEDNAFICKPPVFVLVEKITGGVHASGWNLKFHGFVTTDGEHGSSLAVFTDRALAEDFGKSHAPQHKVLEVPTAAAYYYVLQCVHGIDSVQYDPVRGTKGFRGFLVQLATVLSELQSGGSPDPTDS